MLNHASYDYHASSSIFPQIVMYKCVIPISSRLKLKNRCHTQMHIIRKKKIRTKMCFVSVWKRVGSKSILYSLCYGTIANPTLTTYIRNIHYSYAPVVVDVFAVPYSRSVHT